PNHYRLLGLNVFEGNADVISNAIDQRRSHLRGVQSGAHGLLSQRLLNEVGIAAVTLLNPAKKVEYDQQLDRKLADRQPSPTAAGSSRWLVMAAAAAVALIMLGAGAA